MKKLITLSLLAAVVFSGCSKSAKFAKNITGKWKVTTWDFKQYINGVLDGQRSYSVAAGEFDFKKDRTGTGIIPTESTGKINSTINITNWFCDGANVTLVFDNSVSGDKNVTYTFNATTNEKEAQVWISDVTFKDSFSGLMVNRKLTLTMAVAE